MTIQRQLVENFVPQDWDRAKQPGSGFNRVRWLQGLVDLFNRPVINRATLVSGAAVNTNGAVQSTGIGTIALQPKRYGEFTVKARVRISSPGSSGSALTLQTNGVNNGSQSKLNLVAGTGISLADDGVGDVTITNTAPAVAPAAAPWMFGAGITEIQGAPPAADLSVSLSANDVLTVWKFFLTNPTATFNQITLNGKYALAGSTNIYVGIYDSAGNLVWSSGPQSLLNAQQDYVFPVPPLTLAAGTYYLALAADDFRIAICGFNNNVSWAADNGTSGFNVFNKNLVRVGYAANHVAAGAMPATLGALTAYTLAHSDQPGVPGILFEP